jgi:Predicted ATPase (AAA+ superfamily)
VLCGSAVSFFEKELLAYRSPLFGRRTLSLKLAPLGFPEVRHYLAGYTAEEAVTAYGVVGGTPAHLRLLDPSRSVTENLRALLKLGSYFYEEAPNLLRQELREPRTYMGILAALAGGERRPSQLASAAGIDARTLPKYLSVLEELDIVVRVPKLGGRGAKLDFRDNYFRFWFTFPYRLRHLIEAGFTEEAVEHVERATPLHGACLRGTPPRATPPPLQSAPSPRQARRGGRLVERQG